MVVLNDDQMIAIRRACDAANDEQTKYLLAQVEKICSQQRESQGFKPICDYVSLPN